VDLGRERTIKREERKGRACVCVSGHFWRCVTQCLGGRRILPWWARGGCWRRGRKGQEQREQCREERGGGREAGRLAGVGAGLVELGVGWLLTVGGDGDGGGGWWRRMGLAWLRRCRDEHRPLFNLMGFSWPAVLCFALCFALRCALLCAVLCFVLCCAAMRCC
jgi:hypothetical protein